MTEPPKASFMLDTNCQPAYGFFMKSRKSVALCALLGALLASGAGASADEPILVPITTQLGSTTISGYTIERQFQPPIIFERFLKQHERPGIIGQVVMATWAPSEETPVQCMVCVSTDAGKIVADVRTTEEGWFIMALNPGTYLLTPHYPAFPNGTVIGPTTTVTVTKRDFIAVELPFSFGPE